VEVVHELLDALLAVGGVLELHLGEGNDEVAHVVLDILPGDALVGVCLCGHLDGVGGEVVECDNVAAHADGLVEGAVAVIVRVAVLGEVVVLKAITSG